MDPIWYYDIDISEISSKMFDNEQGKCNVASKNCVTSV